MSDEVRRNANRRQYLSAKERGAIPYYTKPGYKELQMQRQSARIAAFRAEFLAEYGGRCVCCGERESAFLTMDHGGVDGGRRSVIGTTKKGKPLVLCSRGTTEYYRLKKLGWPKDVGIRILCMNCNWATRFGKTCPHPGGVSGHRRGGDEPKAPGRLNWEPKGPAKSGPKEGYKHTEERKARRRAVGWNFCKDGCFAPGPAPNQQERSGLPGGRGGGAPPFGVTEKQIKG